MAIDIYNIPDNCNTVTITGSTTITAGDIIQVADFADNNTTTTYVTTTATSSTCYVNSDGTNTYFKVRTDPMTGLDEMVPMR